MTVKCFCQDVMFSGAEGNKYKSLATCEAVDL